MAGSTAEFPVPDDEEARLWALRQYDVLDTPPEEAFDDLVTVAREIYDVPVAFVGFLDEDREWFKAQQGMEDEELPRSATPCSWGIMTPEGPTIIEDLAEDPRFRDGPVVQEKGYRFYAGVPILSDGGHALGTFCVMDRQPHAFTEERSGGLQALSRTATRILELRRASRDLRDRSRELESFAGAAGERIKDPLSSVTVHHSFLEQDLADASEEIRENLATAMHGTELIERIAEKLMEYAKLDPAAAASADPLDLEPLVEDNWKKLESLVEATGANLELGDLPPVRADRRQARHLVLNLLDNAVRYHEEDPVQVRVSGERLDGTCRFEVVDNGRGIEPDELPRVFDIFYRSSRSKDVDGAGLGLALCEKVVELHGGEIQIESQVGEGTTVTFTLPAADE